MPMVNMVTPKTVRSGYALSKVQETKGSTGKALYLEVAPDDADPYLVENFATHVGTFLKQMRPDLKFGVDSLCNGQVASVYGYNDAEGVITVNVRRGNNGRSVLVDPVFGRDGFLGKYKGVLQQDLVA